ncbi:MAG TPA: hypothetical protein VHB68_18770 [Steroidobacteraceae bacterium]|nr:hypothetical protein [Steroidobacteraceae bacterium]
MRFQMGHRPVAALLLSAACMGLLGSAPLAVGKDAKAADCNRRCLLESLTTYTEAVTDNDVSRIPAAKDVRVTSNGEVVALGKGEVWGHVKRMPYRQAFVDPVTGAAMLFATVTNTPTREGERWWFYLVRLKVVRHEISEVEEIAYDGTLRGSPASSLKLGDRIFDTLLPEDERISRQDLIATANKYFDVVSGVINYRDVPWHPECHRVELGVFTVSSELNPGSCGGEFQNPRVKWIVKNRRMYVVDVERGVVAAVANFTSPPEYPENNASVAFEVFKVQDGLIRHIEAMFRGNSSQSHSGWPDLPAQ